MKLAKLFRRKPPDRHAFLRKRGIRWTIVGPGIAVLIVLIGAAVVITTLGPGPRLRAALALGHLARVPKSASGLQADGTGDARAATFYVRFAAPPGDIEQFIRDSLSIRWVTPELLEPQHMYLPRGTAPPTPTTAAAGSQPSGPVWFEPDPRYPWFDPTVRGPGRRFVIPRDPDGNSGEVIIDDEHNVVFIRVVHG